MSKATKLVKALVAEQPKKSGRCQLCGLPTSGDLCHAHSDLLHPDLRPQRGPDSKAGSR